MAGRKRGADEMDPQDVHMSSTTPSPRPHNATIKRARTDDRGRPLPLSRLLETMDIEVLRDILSRACDASPALVAEVHKAAPKPTAANTLVVIRDYERRFEASFPYGGPRTSPYAYDRVKQQLLLLLEALGDFISSFLPPVETQIATTLQFLDGATSILHKIPNFENAQHTTHKTNAYESISKAWCVALREAEKKGGGIQITNNGWDRRLMKHYEIAGQVLSPAIQELQRVTSWGSSDDRVQNLLSGRSDIGVGANIRREYRIAEVSG